MSDDNLFLGKLPARPGSVKLKFSAYADFSALPPIPKDFGHEDYAPPIDWGMLGNNQYGDCVVAGGAHEHMLWSAIGGKRLTFNTQDVLHDFTGITGLPPNPLTGADMQQAARYRQKVGLLGADGNRHKVAAYIALKPGDLRELYAAMYLFNAVGAGFHFPSSAFDQFRQHRAWAIVSGMHFEGWHYVPCVALRSNIVGITWGRFQAIRPSFYAALCDEALTYLSEEMLVNRKNPEGFDYDSLVADLATIAEM